MCRNFAHKSLHKSLEKKPLSLAKPTLSHLRKGIYEGSRARRNDRTREVLVSATFWYKSGAGVVGQGRAKTCDLPIQGSKRSERRKQRRDQYWSMLSSLPDDDDDGEVIDATFPSSEVIGRNIALGGLILNTTIVPPMTPQGMAL